MELTTSQAVDLFLASLRTRSAPANTIKAYRMELYYQASGAIIILFLEAPYVIGTFPESLSTHRA